MRRTLVLALGLLALLTPLPGGLAAAAAPASPAAMERDFVARINALRASKGLAPLAVHDELTAIGRRWAGRMVQAGRISHNPGFADEVKAPWVKLGENVGRGPDVPTLHDAFVDSPTHYPNLVDRAFTHVGVGVVVAPDGVVYTAHQFMQLAAPAAPPAAAPAPKPAARPRPASRPAARPAPAPPAPAPAPRVVPPRIALSLEQLRGQAPGL